MGIGGLIILVVVGTSIWVMVDATSRGLSWTWGLGCLALWIVAFPMYLVERSKTVRTLPGPRYPPPNAERVVQPPAPPPGYYPDPRSVAKLRWWDGSDWTDTTM